MTLSNVEFLRTPASNFDNLVDFPYAPQFIDIDEMQMHYIDEGPLDGPVMLLLHGMPTWGYLYRNMIPLLVESGFRCIAPDHMGFGRSDKPTDPQWYNIARHTANMQQFIQQLDLRNITIVVQDWGGPIGLAQVANMPERFTRLVILNTWLHHAEYEYTDGIKRWISQWIPGGLFETIIPDSFSVGTLMAMATDRAQPAETLGAVLQGNSPHYDKKIQPIVDAYDAPFLNEGIQALSGPRRFPLSIPLHDPVAGNAIEQEKHFAVINATPLPVHFIWGAEDSVFTLEWGQKWHSYISGSTLDVIDGAKHFLQDTHGPEIVRHILHRIKNS